MSGLGVVLVLMLDNKWTMGLLGGVGVVYGSSSSAAVATVDRKRGWTGWVVVSRLG